MLIFKVNNTLGKKIPIPLHHCWRQDMVNKTLRTTDSMGIMRFSIRFNLIIFKSFLDVNQLSHNQVY